MAVAAFSSTGVGEAGLSTTAAGLSSTGGADFPASEASFSATGADSGALVVSAGASADAILIGGTSVVFSAAPLAAIAAQPPAMVVTAAGTVTDGAEEFLAGSASATTVLAASFTGKTADFSSTVVGTALVTGAPQGDLTGAASGATLFVFLETSEASTTGAAALTTRGLFQTDLGAGTGPLNAGAVVAGGALCVLGGRLALVSCDAGPPRCLPDDVDVDAVDEADEEASLTVSLSRPPPGTF